MTHVMVLPGGGYAQHAAHEGHPIAEWLQGLGFESSVFRYPLHVRHPVPLHALQAEIRCLREDGVTREAWLDSPPAATWLASQR
jgi:hypothetical protein